jgi:predicted RNA-binding Zn ribbon-like protein
MRATVTSATSAPEPADRAPAPGALRLVQDFLNTNDIEGVRDAFASTAGLRTWLVDRELLPRTAVLDEGDRRRAVEAREALRALVISRDEGIDAAEATRQLEATASDAGLTLRIGPGGWDLVPSKRGIHAAIARVLFEVTAAMSNGSWSRLKACRRDACRWVFWDASRNRSGTWCAMSVCGNRVKGAAFRNRRMRDHG